MSLGTFMSEIRAWLDTHKITCNLFRPAPGDVRGYEMAFHREEDAERFRERFATG